VTEVEPAFDTAGKFFEIFALNVSSPPFRMGFAPRGFIKPVFAKEVRRDGIRETKCEGISPPLLVPVREAIVADGFFEFG
jgi:hypothetical protein